MTKTLVLGGTGFIGLELVRALGAAGDHDITVVDNLSRGALDPAAKELFTAIGARFIEADLTDPDAFAELPGRFDEIYLLAGVVGVRYTIERPVHVLRTNALIVTNTVDWWQQTGGRLLYASTSEVYAGSLDIMSPFPTPTPESIPIAITDILNPRFSYAASKTYGESLVNAGALESGHPATIIRFHNVYGPRMGYEHVVPELSLRLVRRENPFVLYGSDQSRAFCFVSDAVAGLIAAMADARPEPRILHIGNDQEETNISDLFDMLCDIAGWQPDTVDRQPAPRGSPTRRCPDITRMREELGVVPLVSLADGLAQTFAWYAGQHPNGQKPEGR